MTILDLNTYKTYKGIGSTTEDTKNTAVINAVNAFIEGYCGRVFTTFYNADKVEYFSSSDTELYPTEYPIVSITSLEYSTDAGQTYGNTLSQYTDYVIDTDNDSVLAMNNLFADTTHKVNALKLTYKGGYAEVPKDLEHAAVLLTEHFISEDYTPRKSMSGTSVDNVIQPDMTARLPSHIRRILENYRSIVF